MKKLKQTHGAVLNTSDDSLLEEFCPKNTTRISLATKYQDKLGSMSLDELQSLAEEVGVIPVDNRNLLIRSIKRELKRS